MDVDALIAIKPQEVPKSLKLVPHKAQFWRKGHFISCWTNLYYIFQQLGLIDQFINCDALIAIKPQEVPKSLKLVPTRLIFGEKVTS